MVKKINPEEVKIWLEWASSKLLSMQISNPAPRAPGSGWPEIARDPIAYGYSGEKLKPAYPRANEITLMDEILSLPSLIPDVTLRRVVNARSLITPVANRHVYSWNKIALMIHSDRRKAASLYEEGIKAIVSNLAPGKAYTIKQNFDSLKI